MMSDDSGSSSDEEIEAKKTKRAYVKKPMTDESKKVLVDKLAKAREAKRIKFEAKKALPPPPPVAPPPPPPPPPPPVAPVKRVRKVKIQEPKVVVRPRYEFV